MSKPFSFAAEAKKAESGSYFKLAEGDNKIRVVSEFVLHESTFTDKKTGETKKSKKFVGYVLDRRDATIKPAFLAKTIVDSIADLQLSDDYRFESVPMPYDVNIRAKNAGTIDVVYNILPLPRTDLTPEQVAEVEQLDVQEYIASLADDGSQPAAKQPSAEDMAKAELAAARPMSAEDAAEFMGAGDGSIPV